MNQSKVNLIFAPLAVTPGEVVAQVSRYVGLPYVQSSTYVEWQSGVPVGRTNCFGLLLLTARELGLLPDDFDVNLSPATFGQSVEKTLIEILHENFTLVGLDAMAAGDVLLLRYRDRDARLVEPHHVAMCVKARALIGEPAFYSAPEMIHAVNMTASGAGSVYRVQMDALFMGRVVSVWRMKNYAGVTT